jgi:transposase
MQTPLDVGVDVASKNIVVACAAHSFASHSVTNERKSLSSWLKSLPKGSRIGMEATGSHHELLMDLAQAAGMVAYVLNPREVKKYAEGIGRRGKTDRLDAEVIARYVAKEHPDLHPAVVRSDAQRRLEQLLKRRSKVVALQIGLAQTWRGVTGAKAELKAVAAAYARLLQRVDALLRELLAELPDIDADAQRLRTIPGFGPVGSVAVAQALRRFPFSRVDAFIAHTGLDPRPHDSGDKRGRRRVSKRGPAALRAALHMCAMSATTTKTWRPYYEQQRAKGLTGTEALVVLSRKMARTAYGMCRSHVAFDATRVSGAT